MVVLWRMEELEAVVELVEPEGVGVLRVHAARVVKRVWGVRRASLARRVHREGREGKVETEAMGRMERQVLRVELEVAITELSGRREIRGRREMRVLMVGRVGRRLEVRTLARGLV